jgi:hypothetical protein
VALTPVLPLFTEGMSPPPPPGCRKARKVNGQCGSDTWNKVRLGADYLNFGSGTFENLPGVQRFGRVNEPYGSSGLDNYVIGRAPLQSRSIVVTTNTPFSHRPRTLTNVPVGRFGGLLLMNRRGIRLSPERRKKRIRLPRDESSMSTSRVPSRTVSSPIADWVEGRARRRLTGVGVEHMLTRTKAVTLNICSLIQLSFSQSGARAEAKGPHAPGGPLRARPGRIVIVCDATPTILVLLTEL